MLLIKNFSWQDRFLCFAFLKSPIFVLDSIVANV
jgi:hypothetical protein